MTNKHKTLYIGVTNNLERRVYEHKHKLVDGFTKKYNIDQRVYFESFNDVKQAIDRETSLKGLLRMKKIALIEGGNSEWKDLAEGWYHREDAVQPSQDSSAGTSE